MKAGELARIHAASFVTPRAWSETEITNILGGYGCFLELAPGGFLIGRVIADEAELLTLAVDPDHRRQGIGQTLVSRFLFEAADRGATRAFLEVIATNEGAKSLYLRAGFVESATRKNYYYAPDGSKFDAVLMTKAPL